MHPVVHVGTADTGPSRLDKHIVWRLQLWNRPILIGKAVGFLENKRRVLHVISLVEQLPVLVEGLSAFNCTQELLMM
jgi:hypothetical protein